MINQISAHIRWMVRRDMPEVLAIEYEYPWCEEDFLRCLRQHNCIGMVVEHNDNIIGFVIYELNHNKINILNLAIHPEFRHRGVGRIIIYKLIGKLSCHRRNQITISLRETALGAQLFLRGLGFRATEVIRGYYPNTEEDAYLMCYSLKGDQI